MGEAAEAMDTKGQECQRDSARVKKTYVPPRLESYGDLRTLTLGGSPGAGDSGCGFNCSENPFGGP